MALTTMIFRIKASTYSNVPYHESRGPFSDVAFTNIDSDWTSTNPIHQPAQARYLLKQKKPQKTLEYGPTRLHGSRRGLHDSLSPLWVPRAHILLLHDDNTSGPVSNFPPLRSHSLSCEMGWQRLFSRYGRSKLPQPVQCYQLMVVDTTTPLVLEPAN